MKRRSRRNPIRVSEPANGNCSRTPDGSTGQRSERRHSCAQEAKESQFTRVVGTAAPVEEEERINRRTAWEDVMHAFGKCASSLLPILSRPAADSVPPCLARDTHRLPDTEAACIDLDGASASAAAFSCARA